jgi:hypothetical protein
MHAAFRDFPGEQQRSANDAVTDHQGGRSPFFLRKLQELSRKFTNDVAVKRHIVRNPEAVEHREQEQRVFRRLSERFGLLDQQTCPLRGCLGFRRRISFDVLKRCDERDLELDLFPAHKGRWG